MNIEMNIIFDLDQTLVDSSIAATNRVNRNWSKVYSQIPNFTVYSYIPEILQLLYHNNIKIAVVTSSPSSYAKKVLHHFDIRYNVLIDYHSSGRILKPSPHSINLALQELQINDPSTVLGIGDLESDIIAYNNAGIQSGYCTWGKTESIKINEKPKFVFDKPEMLYSHIDAYIIGNQINLYTKG